MNIRTAFTLIELVVVIVILGILAAVAAPRLLDTAGTATENGLKQTLSVVRDAIELYAAENAGALPGSDGTQGTFKSDLAPNIRGPFPLGPVGPAQGDDKVHMKSDGVPLVGDLAPTKAWKYDYTTGEFILNYNGLSSDGVTYYDEF